MKSWWELGEGFGERGDSLAIYQIECPFCDERGNFSIEHHAEKKKANSSKVLNFDTLKCGNCAGYVMVLWSVDNYGGLHNYRVLPYPLKISRAPEYWPPAVQRHWIQAHRTLADENWDAAVTMARSALQAALRNKKAIGDNLFDEIENLTSKGILHPIMKDWATEIRVLARASAHPGKDMDIAASPEDASDIVEFMDNLLTYLYDFPKQIQDYRERRNKQKERKNNGD